MRQATQGSTNDHRWLSTINVTSPVKIHLIKIQHSLFRQPCHCSPCEQHHCGRSEQHHALMGASCSQSEHIIFAKQNKAPLSRTLSTTRPASNIIVSAANNIMPSWAHHARKASTSFLRSKTTPPCPCTPKSKEPSNARLLFKNSFSVCPVMLGCSLEVIVALVMDLDQSPILGTARIVNVL